jgi:hypothetical protein
VTYVRVSVLISSCILVLSSCGAASAPEAFGEDLLYISARGGGLAVIGSDAASPTFSGRDATPSSDWETVVRSEWNVNTTRLIATYTASGALRWETVIRELQRVKIVSGDGTRVATSPVNERPYLRGRRMTTLTVAGSGSAEPRRYELEGNFEPEAFSTDGSSLFVVSYLPARKPTNYQVRRLDLTTGKVEGVYTPDAHLQQAMGGTARIQAASPDGSRLYTLYTVAGNSNADARAFVHVLDLNEMWAHCIELPSGFEDADQESGAITVGKDGTHVYLADATTEALVEIDTDKLMVSRTGTVDLDPASGTYLTDSPGGTLYAASGIDVVAIDIDRFEQRAAWLMFSSIAGLQVGADPNELYVGVDDRIIVLDVTTGTRLDSIDPVGVRKIGAFGQVTPPIPSEEDYFTCAC